MQSLSIRDCYRQGFDHGSSLASWNDMPEFGQTLPRHLDWQGIGEIKTVSDALDAWEMIISVAEDNCRQYSPFEFTARAINLRDEERGEGEAQAGWEAFERGTQAGIAAYRRKHYPVNLLKRWRREAEQDGSLAA